MPAGWPPSHPNPDPAPKQEADAAGLRDNTESPTMRRNVLLLFWALYRLKCGDTVEVDAMSEQQLQRAKQLATKVLIQPSP